MGHATPWRGEKFSDGKAVIVQEFPSLPGPAIAEVNGHDNAALIVRAVNAHADLLEACLTARGAYAALALVNPRADYSQPLAQLEAALKKAGI